MKLIFASFATGIFVTASIFMTIVFVRALFKDDASVMFALWVFGWPICFMSSLPGISDHALIWLSLGMGMLLDSVFISGVTYCVLRAIVSRQKRARSALPPQAPTF
jgi:hypothetical protein